MLRESATAFGYDVDIAAVGDPSRALGIPGGDELLRFVDTIMTGSPDELDSARSTIIDHLGPESLVDAASVFGNFEMMNRVAEGTGIQIPRQSIERMRDTIDVLGLERLLRSLEGN